FGAQTVDFRQELTLGQMTRRYGFHFVSLVSIIIFMLWGYSPTLAVFWSTVLTYGLSFLTRETAITPKKLVRPLSDRSTTLLHAAPLWGAGGLRLRGRALAGVGVEFPPAGDGPRGGPLALACVSPGAVCLVRGLGGAGPPLLHLLRGPRGPRHDQARRARLRR